MRHLARVHVPQLDLFRPASPGPDWWQLPAETRERVLRQMTRLLRERRNGRVQRPGLGRACSSRRGSQIGAN